MNSAPPAPRGRPLPFCQTARIARTLSATVPGVEARPIQVEVDLSVGLSNFTIVGRPDGTIRESRERIAAAISNSGYAFPVRRITTIPKQWGRKNFVPLGEHRFSGRNSLHANGGWGGAVKRIQSRKLLNWMGKP